MQIYRTPFMLRHCTSLLIHLVAVVLGPYFSHIAVCDEDWVVAQHWCPAPYVMAVIYSIICMLLLNVQVCGHVCMWGIVCMYVTGAKVYATATRVRCSEGQAYTLLTH
jgi:hypothetical protein